MTTTTLERRVTVSFAHGLWQLIRKLRPLQYLRNPKPYYAYYMRGRPGPAWCEKHNFSYPSDAADALFKQLRQR